MFDKNNVQYNYEFGEIISKLFLSYYLPSKITDRRARLIINHNHVCHCPLWRSERAYMLCTCMCVVYTIYISIPQKHKKKRYTHS